MTASATRHRFRPLLSNRRRPLAALVTGAAALAVVTRYVAVLLVNAPGWTGPPVGTDLLTAGVTAVAALATVTLALTERDPTAGVGLLFVGVFGLLSLVDGAAAVPAAGAVVVGTAVVVAASRRELSPGETGVATVLVAALAVGLVSGVGGRVGLRPLVSTVSLVGVGVTPVFAATDGRAVVTGSVAFGAVVAVGLSRPFLTGAVTLTGSGVVGTSLPVVALAVAGAVTTASAALRTRRWTLLAGVALVAVAGVPVTLGRAVPFALGVAALTAGEDGR